MEHVTWIEHVTLERPSLVCAFRGWNDGGEASTIAARYLSERWNARPIALIDPEEFFDFQVARPTVRLASGVSRVIEWPRCEFSLARIGDRDVVIYTSNEPNVRWKAYTDTVLGVARELGSSLLVTLGAFLTDVPHTRVVPVVGSAEDEETASQLGLSRSQYEGPTGIVGVLHDASNRAGLPSVSLWAAVPHYLPAAPNPKAALALVGRISALLGVAVDTGPLMEAVSAWEEGIARLVRENDELSGYVERLESVADEVQPDVHLPDPGVSGDVIAAELERFLREQEGGGETR